MAPTPARTTTLGGQLQHPVNEPQKIHQTVHAWKTADLDLFNQLQQHVQCNLAQTTKFIKLNTTLGLLQRGTEFEDLCTLLA